MSSIAAPQLSKGVTFLSAWFCPFAQRTALALELKGVKHEYFEVALKNPQTGLWHQLDEKPQWWLDLNPLGKVPVLAWLDEQGEAQSVYESNVCNEFLEDAHPQVPLLPRDPLRRAHARQVIDRFASRFVPPWYRFLIRQDKESQAECARTLSAELRWLQSRLDPTGPFFLGPEPSLVDCSLLPWFTRMTVLRHYRGFDYPEDCGRLRRWAEHVAAQPFVRSTELAPPGGGTYGDALLHEHYSKYADATANSTSAADFK